MNLISRNNQKTLIFLKKEADFTLASVMLLTYEENGRVVRKHVGTQKITAEQLTELYAEREQLALKDIFLIDVDTDATTATVLLDGVSSVFDIENGQLIPSPYFYNLVDLPIFLTTQKTRGPNSK